jgi:tetratricopeptide (TPR) repeat protein
MAPNNAYDFLRQSITGSPAQSPPSSPADADSTPDETPIPPILVVPSGMEQDEFIRRIERAYKIDYVPPVFDPPLTTEQAEIEHAIYLMDEGIAMAMVENSAGASDMFSLANILYPNYVFNFLLATTRFNLKDYQGALKFLENALDQIRTGQTLNEEIAAFAQSIDFTEHFYPAYISTLLYNAKFDNAKNIINFVLQKNLLKNVISYFEIMSLLQILGEKSMLAKMAKQVAPLVDSIPDPTEKAAAFNNLRYLLTNFDNTAH